MRRSILIVGAAAIALVAFGTAGWEASASAPKPRGQAPSSAPKAPIEIRITPRPERPEDREGEHRLQVTVTPGVDALKLEVTVTLPPGVKLVRGEREWQAPARAREAQTRELLLLVPAEGGPRVVVTARLLFGKSLPLGATTGHTFNVRSTTTRPE